MFSVIFDYLNGLNIWSAKIKNKLKHSDKYCIAGADGTFDILKYADPDLDLGSDNKTIFDDLVEDVKPQDEQKKEGKKEDEFSEVKTKAKQENEGKINH